MRWPRAFVGTLFRGLARPVIRPFVRRSRGKRRILLACHNALTASYLAEIRDLLCDDPRLDLTLCLRRPEHHPGDWQACRALLPLREVAHPMATLLPWDLVIMADHAGAFHALATPERHAVVRISHGIGGKRSAGQDYFYGGMCFDPQGRPIYSCLFESSAARRAEALRLAPALGQRVTVVGSLRADRIRRARLALPSPTGRIRVLVASSWGPHNLFRQLGEPLLDELTRLADRYAFTLRPHPHLVSAKATVQEKWPDFFARAQKAGLHYSNPDTSAEHALAGTDWLICDDLSSMGLLGALAGLRVAIFPSGSANVGPDSFLAALRECSPRIRSVSEIEPALAALHSAWPPPNLDQLCLEMNSEPGRSAELTRQALYRLLNLPEHPTS